MGADPDQATEAIEEELRIIEHRPKTRLKREYRQVLAAMRGKSEQPALAIDEVVGEGKE